MKYTSHLRTLAAFFASTTVFSATSTALFADDDKKTGRISVQQADGNNVEIEIEPGGFIIESDGDVIEFHGGDSGKKTMSLNLKDILGQNGEALADVISDLVNAHPEQAGKLAQRFLGGGGDLLDIVGDDSSSFTELFAAGIEEAPAPYFIGVTVEVPSDALLSHLNLEKGTALLVKTVVEGSPAAKAGFQKYDVISAKGGTALGSREDLIALVTKAGETETAVDLVRISKGEKQEVSLVPAKRKPNAFGAAFFGEGVIVPDASKTADHDDETTSDSEAQAELKAVRAELDEQRKMLENILSKLSANGDE